MRAWASEGARDDGMHPAIKLPTETDRNHVPDEAAAWLSEPTEDLTEEELTRLRQRDAEVCAKVVKVGWSMIEAVKKYAAEQESMIECRIGISYGQVTCVVCCMYDMCCIDDMRCKLLVSIAISYGQVPAAVCRPYVRACMFVREYVGACVLARAGRKGGWDGGFGMHDCMDAACQLWPLAWMHAEGS